MKINSDFKKSLLITILISFLLSLVVSIGIFFSLEQLYPYKETIIEYDDNGEIAAVHRTTLTAEEEQFFSCLQIIQPSITIIFFFIANYMLLSYFYKKKWEGSLKEILDGAERIANNDLDFEVHVLSSDELGMACQFLEKVRKSTQELIYQQIKTEQIREQMMASFAHDLKTPLTIINGEVDIVTRLLNKEQMDREAISESFPVIKNNVRRIENNVDAMRKMLTLESGTIHPVECSYSTFIDTVKHHLELLTLNTGKDVSYNFCSNTEKILQIDLEVFFIVLDNIITNSIRYSNHIDVDIDFQDHILSVNVQDDGPGFTEYILKHGMEPFVRDSKEPQNHFGLGLYICHVLCQKHGGSFSIENSERGALCKMTLNV